MSKLEQAKQIAAKYRTDPHVWGRTKQTVGGLLVADGLVGLENPFDGKKTRPGIAGAAVLLVIGLMFVFAGFTVVSGKADTDATTMGTIIQVNRGGDTCSVEAEYTVNGKTYQASTFGSSSGDCQKHVGQLVKVAYQSAHPEVAQVKGIGDWVVWIFPVVGAIVAMSGFVTFAIRAVSIVGGAVLFFNGRKQAKEHPDSNGNAAAAVEQVRSEMLALLTAARGKVGPVGVNPAAALGGAVGGGLGGGLGGAVGGGVGSLLGGVLGVAQQATQQAQHAQQPPTFYPQSPTGPATVPPAYPAYGAPQNPVAPPVAPPVPAGPPVGWYPTADGQFERYWDGQAWSAEARPAGSA